MDGVEPFSSDDIFKSLLMLAYLSLNLLFV